ncbi:hypothetical protein DXG03_004817 [Asterophora parasitica]|uniref:Uncharacterized protein n=1 Tax=Asterophora parasitica TaxID=117018 RepID=A0A9P7G220_9AGAR|nr:hypothetical protein DXG03_004817 [Asterophora parasitica]
MLNAREPPREPGDSEHSLGTPLRVQFQTTSDVSHRFYALSETVWLVLLTTLQKRVLIGLPPDHWQSLEQLSTQGLVDLVKRAVLGPKSWLASDSSTTPIAPAQQIVLNRDRISPGPIGKSNDTKQILLQGGNFVLFHYDYRVKCLECRDLRANRRLWVYEGLVDRWSKAYVRNFAAEVADEGKTVNILIGIVKFDDSGYSLVHK